MQHFTHHLKIRLLLQFLLTLFSTSSLFAQHSITSVINLPQAGDRLTLQEVTGISPGPSGENATWDFSHYEVVRNDLPRHFVMDSLGYIRKEIGQYEYYSVSGDSVLLRASRTSKEMMRYWQPMLFMRYPMHYGDSIKGIFRGDGAYCKRYHLHREGDRVVKADAWGCILLPGDRKIKNVTRLHSTTTYETLMSGMDAQRGDTATARHEVIENYWWYAEGCRHPVFEYAKHTSYSAGQAVGRVSTAYCVSIDGTLDTLIQADSEASPSAEENPEGLPIHYTLSQEGNVLHLLYTIDTTANVTFRIATPSGMLIRRESHECPGGIQNNITFDCTGFRAGSYILHIEVDGQLVSEKFNVK